MSPDVDCFSANGQPVFFAASELSPSFPGYIEGAIVAGRAAAALYETGHGLVHFRHRLQSGRAARKV